MTKDQYDSLDAKDKLFMDVLLDIARSLRVLQADISRDIEEMK
jgi:hypothetical protein